MVAEAGFEPRDFQVMGLTSYQAALLRDDIAILLKGFYFFKKKVMELENRCR